MLENLLVTESLSVEIMLVHLAGISISLPSDFNILDSTSAELGILPNVKIPDRRYQVLEVGITLDL